MMNRFLQALAVAFVAAAAICVAGQNTAPKGPLPKGPGPAQIKGAVRDAARRPIAGVAIAIEGAGVNGPVSARVVTDGNGNYSKVMDHGEFHRHAH